MIDERRYRLFTETFNVHSVPGREVFDTTLELRWAGEMVWTQCIRTALDYRAPARRTFGWHLKSGTALPPRFRNAFDNLGNDIAGTLYPYQIPRTGILALYLFAIVQSGARYRHAADLDGTHQRDRSQDTGATNLDGDLFDPGHFATRREFVGNRPPWMVGCRAKPGAGRKLVELDHDSIDFVRQAIPHRGQLGMLFCDFTYG
jgi:hypothetical protein